MFQTLCNDKVQVRLRGFFLCDDDYEKMLHSLSAASLYVSLCAFQYGVSVIKYDRRGFKPRPRQLLLTNNFAVLVDRTKIKQRIDYTALRGDNQS